MAIDEKNYAGIAFDQSTGKIHPINHQPEEAEWETGIYQWEPGDFVIGGINGLMNLPLRQLTNRTVYLKGLFGLLVEFVKDAKDKIPPTLPIRSASREAMALPMDMKAVSPGAKSAWIATDAGEAANVQTEYVLEDGRKLTGMGTVTTGSDSRYVGGEKAGTATEDAACIVFDGAVEQAGLHPTYTLEDGTVIQDARATITGSGGTFYVGGPAAGIDWDKIIDGGILPPGSGTISHEDIDHIFS